PSTATRRRGLARTAARGFRPGLLVDEDRVDQATGSEMLVVDLLPAAEDVLDSDEADFRELVGEFGGNLLVMDPVAIARDDPLCLRRVEELEKGLGHVATAARIDHAVDHCDRKLGKKTHRRYDGVVVVLADLVDDGVDLGLEGHQNVADPAP